MIEGIVASASKPSVVSGPLLDRDDGPETHTIPGFARAVAGRWAEREALVSHTAAGDVKWTYAELWQNSLAVARSLVANGVSKDARVGILMSNRPEYIAATFGIALAGGVVVGLNTFVTPSELAQLLRVSSIDTLLFERTVVKKDFGAMLAELEPAILNIRRDGLVSSRFPYLRRLVSVNEGIRADEPGLTNWGNFIRQGQSIPDEVIEKRGTTIVPSDTAILFFSSGSTGVPKGVLHSHRAVALQWSRWPAALGVSGDIRSWTANGFFWSGNFSMVIGSALAAGGALVLQSGFDPKAALHLMVQERVNAPFAMPHQWGRIAEEPDFERTDLSGLRWFDPKFVGLQHPAMPTHYRQLQGFGCTETLTISTTTRFGTVEPMRNEGHGIPLPGNTLKIVDPSTGEIVPRGERGEIAVKGPTLMTGYLGKSREECFDEEGFFHTGDGGYLDESGWLYWEGRLTDIIKTGGANVSPEEVDDVIRTFPAVTAAQTVGLPHKTLGEIVVSCIVPLDEASFDKGALLAFLKDRLASYKLPRRILMLSEADLALTGSGNKIRSAEVRKLAAARIEAEERGAQPG